MPFRFLLDENLRGDLWEAIQHHNAAGLHPLDAGRVGDPPHVALGTPDPDILLRCEQEGLLLVTLDKNTMPGHFAQHLRLGHHSPGVFIIRVSCTLAEAVAFLVAAAYASDLREWQDLMTYVP